MYCPFFMKTIKEGLQRKSDKLRQHGEFHKFTQKTTHFIMDRGLEYHVNLD